MISVEFAPNEQFDDALLSFSLLFQPWRWRNGPELQEVKERLAAMVNEKPEHVTLYLSGRAGIHHIYKNLDLQKRSKVLVTGFTCEAVVLPLRDLDLIPGYIDVTKSDCSINPKLIDTQISKNTSSLLIQHSFGIPPGRSELLDIAAKNNLVVVEDLAHGFQKDTFVNDKVNTIKLLSFGRSKSFSSVFGGAVITDNKDLQDRLLNDEKDLNDVTTVELFKLLNYKPLTWLIKSTYSTLSLGRALHKICVSLKILVPEISKKEKRGVYDTYFDKAYPNALAILLLHQLKKFDKTYSQRKKISALYRKHLNNHIKDDYSLPRFPVFVTDRQRVLEEGRGYGMYFGKWYTQPVAPAEIDLEQVGYKKGSCPVAEEICDSIINLPTTISEETAKDIIEIVKPYVKA